jgi:hypothetical protein
VSRLDGKQTEEIHRPLMLRNLSGGTTLSFLALRAQYGGPHEARLAGAVQSVGIAGVFDDLRRNHPHLGVGTIRESTRDDTPAQFEGF